MKKEYNSINEYHLRILNGILKLLPAVALCALATFTAARLAGLFSDVSLPALAAFDLACLSYCAVCGVLRKTEALKEGEADDALARVEYVLVGIILFQWNIITYVFHISDFWGYAPLFLLMAAFMFRTEPVLICTAGLSGSIIVSWLIIPEHMLPVHDGTFTENMVMRAVALVLTFAVINVLTAYSEKITVTARKNEKFLRKQNSQLEGLSRDVIEFTADLIEQRDTVSGSHVKRLKGYTKILAGEAAGRYPEYGLDQRKIELISMASALHDVGKICISDSILQKKGPLTEEEFEVMKTHTRLGAQIIDSMPASVEEEYRRYCREICYYHHEKYNGEGYPCGLKGEEIPIAAQIVSVVDCYDALCTDRPYKKAYPPDIAVGMILDGQCGSFSDKMKNCLAASREKLAEQL